MGTMSCFGIMTWFICSLNGESERTGEDTLPLAKAGKLLGVRESDLVCRATRLSCDRIKGVSFRCIRGRLLSPTHKQLSLILAAVKPFLLQFELFLTGALRADI